jgi:hypothetical protein
VGRYPYLPTKVVDSVADLLELVDADDPTA